MNDEHPDGRGPVRHRRVVGPTQDSTISLFGSNSWIGCPGINVEIACLYTSCECASRRNNTQKLSNQVIIPCNFTPLTRKIVTGVLFFRTWFKNTSWTFCDFSGVMDIPRSLLGAERASSCQMNEYSNEAAEFPIGRWARDDESQALHKAKQG